MINIEDDNNVIKKTLNFKFTNFKFSRPDF